MDTMEKILLIVVPLGLVYILVRIILQQKAIGVMNKIGKENILLIASDANFFGQNSAGFKQIKGNGTLVLTKEKLYFELLLPKKVIEIPLKKIERIEEDRSHLGKTTGSKLMKIIYRNESGSIDCCAWLVRNRKAWFNQIEQLLK